MGVQSKFTDSTRQEIIKRKTQGEPVTSLAKQYKVSVPRIYQWIQEARESASKTVTARTKAGLALDGSSIKKEQASNTTEMQLMLQDQAMQIEQLKKKLFELMLETGKL